MYGILWSKSGYDSVLTQAGQPYSYLDAYLEDAYMHSRYYREGYIPSIVSVHKEDGEWRY